MNKILIVTAAACIALAAPAFAKNNGNNGNGNGHGENARVERIANPSNGGCPPGLAKKDPPCIPPGQARGIDDDDYKYRIGDRIDRDYILIDRRAYDLPRLNDGEAYVRVGDRIVRMDRDERLVLDILDVVLN